MKKFMAMYMAPAATIAEMMKATPEQMKTGMDDWMKWSDAHKKQIVELGAPLGKTKRVTTSGMSWVCRRSLYVVFALTRRFVRFGRPDLQGPSAPEHAGDDHRSPRVR